MTAHGGFVSLQTVAEQVTWQLMQSDGDRWVDHSSGLEVSEEGTVNLVSRTLKRTQRIALFA